MKTKVQVDAAFGAVIGIILFYGLVWATTKVQTYRVLGMIIGAAVGAAAGAKYGAQALILGVVFVAVLVVGSWAIIILAHSTRCLIKTIVTAAVGPPGTYIHTLSLFLLMTLPSGILLGRRNRTLTLPVLAIGYIGGGQQLEQQLLQ